MLSDDIKGEGVNDAPVIKEEENDDLHAQLCVLLKIIYYLRSVNALKARNKDVSWNVLVAHLHIFCDRYLAQNICVVVHTAVVVEEKRDGGYSGHLYRLHALANCSQNLRQIK